MKRRVGTLVLWWWRFESRAPRISRWVAAALEVGIIAGLLAIYTWVITR